MEIKRSPANPRWRVRPAGSNWGDYGPDDQRGTLNLITSECVRAAAAEIRMGRSFCLSLPLDLPGGTGLNANRYPPVLRPTLRAGKVNFNCRLGGDASTRPDVLCDDLAILHLQYSTQWDALAHVGATFDVDGVGVAKPVYYNGYAAFEHVTGPASDDADQAGTAHAGSSLPLASTSTAHALGVENIAQTCVQGRGVLLDLHAHFGDARSLVGYDALAAVLEHDRVRVEPGDILCIHTGFAELLMRADGKPDDATLHHRGAVLDGRDERLLNWISTARIAAIAADNYAVESYPADTPEHCSVLPLHHHCLFKLGLPLGELWRLTPLAQWLRGESRYRFFLTAPPLFLRGAVGSPVTPVATV